MKGKKKSLTEVKEDFKRVWGDKYDYSLITKETYINMATKVPIICREHGIFYQTPHSHVFGHGCTLCGKETQGGGAHLKGRSLVCGIGINDSKTSTSNYHKHSGAYRLWKSMIGRCYGEKTKGTPYEKCSVCDEWLYFSNFEKWYNKNYVKGYHLDKDLLIKGNKIYSPQTCSFVPPEINTILVKHNATRGDLPIGVSRCGGRSNKFRAVLRIKGEYVVLGSFNTPDLAFCAYKKAKEKHIKEMALQYYNANKISKNIFDSLMKYEVEITD